MQWQQNAQQNFQFPNNMGFGPGPQMSAPGEQIAMEPMVMEPMKLGSASFNKEVKAFIPKGKLVTTAEEFPDLGDDDDKPKQQKKKKEKKVTKVKEEEEVDMSGPWRGKPSSFFVMQ